MRTQNQFWEICQTLCVSNRKFFDCAMDDRLWRMVCKWETDTEAGIKHQDTSSHQLRDFWIHTKWNASLTVFHLIHALIANGITRDLCFDVCQKKCEATSKPQWSPEDKSGTMQGNSLRTLPMVTLLGTKGWRAALHGYLSGTCFSSCTSAINTQGATKLITNRE